MWDGATQSMYRRRPERANDSCKGAAREMAPAQFVQRPGCAPAAASRGPRPAPACRMCGPLTKNAGEGRAHPESTRIMVQCAFMQRTVVASDVPTPGHYDR